MFRPSAPVTGASTTARTPRHHLKRAGLFAAGLLALWLAMQLFPGLPSQRAMPTETQSAVAPTRSADAAVEARRTPASGRPPELVTPGNAAALLLLTGGVVLAIYLHRRKRDEGSPHNLIEPVASYALSANQQLRLIRCNGETLLIGATDHHINVLRRYAADDFDALPQAAGDGAAAEEPPQWSAGGDSPFEQVLRQYTGSSNSNRS